ncbi:cyclin-dependent kinase 6-like [Contarinia nasturtii]|uniref:cyclin-dependent kinase 6-like n=1 Tax=Contarinia nasturtii TaxID=265458 RepID=UPI0012D44EAC|nr:cyclin-dependent kinase 6-like [Contarinia nasturtii]
MVYDLHVKIHEKPGTITTNRIKNVMEMLLSALCHMHERRIIHRDLKPCNILVNKDGLIKVCDFGLAKTLEHGEFLKYAAGTRQYQPPEMFLQQYNEKADIWAAGCIMGEMILRDYLIPQVHSHEMLEKHFEIFGSPTMNDWPEGYLLTRSYKKYSGTIERLLKGVDETIKVFISYLMILNPHKRPSASNAKLHRFIADHGHAN